MPNNVVSLVMPHDVRPTSGFLAQRFYANGAARLNNPLLSEHFIRLHEKKDDDNWFWMGEQIGKWLDASAYTALITGDNSLLQRVHELIERLARSQEEDGYLGITRKSHRNPVRGMELYEMYYVLHGLLVCADLLKSETALRTARRLGDMIMRIWGPEPGQFPLAGRYPGNGHMGGEGTLILEPMVLLGRQTHDARYLEWCESTVQHWEQWWARSPESSQSCGYTTMQQFAAGEKDLWELRENMHAHTFHMTLLGIAELYAATGKAEYRDVVVGSVNRLAEEWIFLTGGMSSAETYGPRRYYHPRNQIEVCPQHTWLLLLQRALEWTGDARYAHEIERDLFNHFLAAQLGDGSNWSYFTPLNGKADEPLGPNCCNGAGHRIAGRMPVFLYGLRRNAPAVFLYSASTATLRPNGGPAVTLTQQTDFPSSGEVSISVEPERSNAFALHLRIPPYASGARVRVNDVAVPAVVAGDFVVVDRTWQHGDVVRLSLPFPLTCRAGQETVAVTRGPLVYAYFQNAQPDPVIFHEHQGVYPEDVELLLDPADPASSIREHEAKEGLLGPALLVSGRIRQQTPIFAAAKANAALPGAVEQAVVLHPFANQGTLKGDYAVFMAYR